MDHLPLGVGTREEFLQWTDDEAITAGNYCLRRIEEFGFPPESDNRIERAIALIRRTAQFDVQYEVGRTTEAVCQAHKTLFECYIILRKLQKPMAATQKLIRSMLRAPDEPLTSQDDPGRDAQSELFTAALFGAAGYHVDLGEPDLHIWNDRFRWGVAVKRVKSERKFGKRVKEAQRQLLRQKLYGFVVVNPELLLSKLVAANLDDDEVRRLLFARTADWADYLDKSDHENRVLAVMAIATAFRFVRIESRRHFLFTLYLHIRFVTSGDPNELRALEGVAQDFGRGLKRSLAEVTQELG